MIRPVPGFPPITRAAELQALDDAIDVLEDVELPTAILPTRKTVAALTHLRDRLTPD